MVVNTEEFKKKISLLGLSIAKGIPTKNNMKLIEFTTKNNEVYACTYNDVDNIKVHIGHSDTDFYLAVEYESFNSFIKSCEGDTITLENKDSNIQIKSSNVKGKLPSFNDSKINIPDPENYNSNYDQSLDTTIDISSLKSVINENNVIPVYRQVYFNDVIMVSDTDNVIYNKTRVFNKNFLLNISSINILNKLSNITYTFNNKYLNIKSDECIASMIIDFNTNNDFQYTDLLELFDTVNGANVEIDTTILTKALSTSQIFKAIPNMVFNSKGVFLNIAASDFIYQISKSPCSDHVFKLDSELSKKICAFSKEIYVYYENDNLIKCVDKNNPNIVAIFSVETIKNE